MPVLMSANKIGDKMIEVTCSYQLHDTPGTHARSTTCVNPVEPAMTKTRVRMLAKRSTAQGFFKHGSELSTRCPRCNAKVSTTYSMWATDGKGKRLNEIQQLRLEVEKHLEWKECSDL